VSGIEQFTADLLTI